MGYAHVGLSETRIMEIDQHVGFCEMYAFVAFLPLFCGFTRAHIPNFADEPK